MIIKTETAHMTIIPDLENAASQTFHQYIKLFRKVTFNLAPPGFVWPDSETGATYLSVLTHLETHAATPDSAPSALPGVVPCHSDHSPAFQVAIGLFCFVLEGFICKAHNALMTFGPEIESALSRGRESNTQAAWDLMKGIAFQVRIIHDLLQVRIVPGFPNPVVSNEAAEWPIRFPIRSADDIRLLRRRFG
jgi:hypothetical protein